MRPKALTPRFRNAAIGIALALIPLFIAGPVQAQKVDKVPEKLKVSVEAGLNHLATMQNSKGCWAGSYGSNPGIVGLGILSFLARGEVPGEGRYGKVINKSINYILAQQKSNGLLSGSGSAMYSHGFATLALAEVYGHGQTKDDRRIGRALKSAVDLIINAQNQLGGWRYGVGGTSADITVTGCQMMALRAAANAGIPVPAKTIKRGAEYIRSLACGGGGFGYTSPSGPNVPRTGIGVLVLSLTGYYRSPEVKAGADYLLARGFDSSWYYYALYYCSQAMFQAGGRYWRDWNEANMMTLLGTQQSDGSWTGRGRGPAYSTIMALLSLELNWRLLPIYQR
ncbi:MAG: terpene cyclase/mutase family protein [Phycisphaerae bacterium]|jgi:hypothetical protein|nr:terpene cyclase/mutase family protein [Phycisphaerae bacterium]